MEYFDYYQHQEILKEIEKDRLKNASNNDKEHIKANSSTWRQSASTTYKPGKRDTWVRAQLMHIYYLAMFEKEQKNLTIALSVLKELRNFPENDFKDDAINTDLNSIYAKICSSMAKTYLNMPEKPNGKSNGKSNGHHLNKSN